MNPIHHPACNTTLLPPPGQEETCGVLPINREADGVTSYWQPSAEELALLNAGGAVAMKAWSSTHPPVSLGAVAGSGAKPAKKAGPPLKEISHMRGLGMPMAFAFDTESKPGKVIVHSLRFQTMELKNDATYDKTNFHIIAEEHDKRLAHLVGLYGD